MKQFEYSSVNSIFLRSTKFFVFESNLLIVFDTRYAAVPSSVLILEIKRARILRAQTSSLFQFRPSIALCTDLSHITTELWEIPVLRMAH